MQKSMKEYVKEYSFQLDSKYNKDNREKFSLWIDDQIRPTIGATVKKYGDKTRHHTGDDTFVAILKTLSDACAKLVSEYQSTAYYVYAVGNWQRKKELFHVKVHLPTTVFLTLTDRVREGSNIFATQEAGLKEREAKVHREKALREVLKEVLESVKGKKGFHIDHEIKDGFSVATATELDYPLICLYQTSGGKITTSIAINELPRALNVLEGYLGGSWGLKGFQVAMVLSPAASLEFEVAAIVDEKEYATRTEKSEKEVKRKWGWEESKREYWQK